ncbi:hypothetical protein [Helicobacter heilmannii]|nr:hypothetical protein [Helicobacter heilmannii]
MLWDRNYHFDLPRPILRLLDILEAGGLRRWWWGAVCAIFS